MRMWIRGAGLAAVIAIFATGCIEEADTGVKAGAESEHATAPASDQTAKSSTITAALSEWTIALSQTSIDHGTVSFEIRNNGTEDHAFEVTGANNQEWKTEAIKPGEAATLSVALAAGTYDVYCPQASGGEAHADRGMKTTITVR
jgi:uncharacterized cupredoxin-like copper-binding protein